MWRLDRHTLAKHEILRPYLRAWFPIMSKYNGRLVFFDGSAGPGSYEKEEPGSPLMPPCEGGEEATLRRNGWWPPPLVLKGVPCEMCDQPTGSPTGRRSGRRRRMAVAQ